MKLDLGTIVVLALFFFGLLCFFVNIPTGNIDILKTIITAFVAFVTGAAVGITIGKSKGDIPDEKTVAVDPAGTPGV